MKLSELDDGGDLQENDDLYVARAGEPMRIKGSALGSGGSQPLSGVQLALTGSAGGADMYFPLPVKLSYYENGIPLSLTSGPDKFEEDPDGLFPRFPSVIAPSVTAISVDHCTYRVGSLDGTQKLVVEQNTPFVVPAGVTNGYIPFADAEIIQQIGSDLSMISFGDGFVGIGSLAGGEFMQTFWVQISCDLITQDVG